MNKPAEYSGLAVAMSLMAGLPVLQQDATEAAVEMTGAAPAPDTGDTGWIMGSTSLVLFVIVPGIVRFYGGLVPRKNRLPMADAGDHHGGALDG